MKFLGEFSWWKALEQGQKRTILLIMAVCLLAITGYVIGTAKREEVQAQAQSKTLEQPRRITLGGEGSNVLRASSISDREIEFEKQKKEIERLTTLGNAERQKAAEFFDKQTNAKPDGAGGGASQPTQPPPPPGLNGANAGNVGIPPPPPPPGGANVPCAGVGCASPPNTPPSSSPAMKYAEVGGFMVVKGNAATKKAAEAPEAAKKKVIAYIPSGTYMEAMILNGVIAAVVANANAGTSPALLRVQLPAQLPNEVKKDLTGCFIIGNAKGSLATERAHIRTVSLSCIDKNKQAVIDQPIFGYIANRKDGIEGIPGRVVAKFDKALHAAIIAGVLKGVGDVVKASAQTSTLSPLGQTSTLDTSKLGQGALGGGLSGAADKLGDFYMKIAELGMPVIEIGTEIPVYVVLEKGVELELKDICQGGNCGN